ncbi:MAG: hypothetical protein ACLQGP_28625, partial [Isosphaeraceae bacterium]
MILHKRLVRPSGFARKRRPSFPLLENLESRLVLSGGASQIAVTIDPPASIVQDGVFGTVAAVEDADGDVVTGFVGTATISLVSGPGGTLNGTRTVPVTDGLAVFDGLSLSSSHVGTDYGLRITTTIPGVGTVSTSDGPVDVASAATSGVGNYYPLPMEGSPSGDIAAANADGDATNNILWIYQAFYPIDSGQIAIRNASDLPGKTLNLLGSFSQPVSPGAGVFGPRIGVGGDARDRLFEITGGPSLVVNVTDIDFYGGQAVDDGGLSIPGISAAGGAFLIDGGGVDMSHVGISGASAAGSAGQSGADGAFNGDRGATGGPGSPGGDGGNAAGGGIFLDAGDLTLTNDSLADDRALGGEGGEGGHGGNGATIVHSGSNSYYPYPYLGNGGAGGAGGAGGSAQGGAIYVAGGTLSVNNSVIGPDEAIGGTGGIGGAGGRAGVRGYPSVLHAGDGGQGGNA